MNVPAPDWVSFGGDETRGQDLLGLRALVQEQGNHLFDGVTTGTPHLRYMSLICWIIWRYAQARLPENSSSFYEFAAAQEAVFVMANRTLGRNVTRLVGVEPADKALDSKGKMLTLMRGIEHIALNDYIASSRHLKLTSQAEHGLNKLSEERGLALAKEFDKALHGTKYGAHLAKAKRISKISREELKDLATPMSIMAIPPRERDILIHVLMPQKPMDDAERLRLRHYALLLWLTNAKRRPVKEDDIFEAAQRPPKGLPPVLFGSTDGFLAYVVRDCLAVCHEYVFAAVMRIVDGIFQERNAPALSSEVAASLVADSEEKDKALRAFKLLKSGETAHTLSFRTVYDRVQTRCRKSRLESNSIVRWQGGISETKLYSHAILSEDAAVSLLPVAWCLACERAPKNRGIGIVQEEQLGTAGPFRIGIDSVISTKIEAYLEGQFSYRDVMSDLVMLTVQQHLCTVWRRFAAPNGKDTSVLIADNDTLARNNVFKPDRTASRLPTAIDWLVQLKLISKNGLTKTGKGILDRSLKALGNP